MDDDVLVGIALCLGRPQPGSFKLTLTMYMRDRDLSNAVGDRASASEPTKFHCAARLLQTIRPVKDWIGRVNLFYRFPAIANFGAVVIQQVVRGLSREYPVFLGRVKLLWNIDRFI